MTGRIITLRAADDHRFSAYLAEPETAPLGAVVVIQEIFGVNSHICDVCDRWAAKGFRAVAPALFDRIERGVSLAYDPSGTGRGRALRQSLGWEDPLKDIAAAADAVGRGGPVAVVGFCWGGSLAWLSACRLRLVAAACYYGGQIVDFQEEHPHCPTELHFGSADPLIPPEHVEAIRERHPGTPLYLYEAGHGFNCDRRQDFDVEASAVAQQRTEALFARAFDLGPNWGAPNGSDS
ncbi:MAG: dienelactone hydrolase family protein [Rhodospirillaceae bacterium]